MKIKIEITLDIDAQKWANEFGVEKKNVREDVRDYFRCQCFDQLSAIKLGKQEGEAGNE